mmetsp:Transcript_7156/g.15529  ORF Transcript_7156/g.15529 Transcript_7156/m.15529 type:complete len:349 (-) Transcript_7156:340-1386(-)
MRRHVNVPHALFLLLQRRQLVKMRGKQRGTPQLPHDIFRNGPGDAVPVERGGAPAQLIDDDQGPGRGGVEHAGGFQHLGHEGGYALLLQISRSHAAQDAIDDVDGGRGGGKEGAHLGHGDQGAQGADVGGFASHVGTRDEKKGGFVVEQAVVVGNVVHPVLELYARMPGLEDVDPVPFPVPVRQGGPAVSSPTVRRRRRFGEARQHVQLPARRRHSFQDRYIGLHHLRGLLHNFFGASFVLFPRFGAGCGRLPQGPGGKVHPVLEDPEHLHLQASVGVEIHPQSLFVVGVHQSKLVTAAGRHGPPRLPVSLQLHPAGGPPKVSPSRVHVGVGRLDGGVRLREGVRQFL